MSRRLLGLLIPLACAALFVRLGFWQLSRHRDRAAVNAVLAAELVRPPIPLDSLCQPAAGDCQLATQGFRRVRVVGRFRYDLEQVQAGRTNQGSPGVHLLTPLKRAGTDTLLVVVRGWVYSPDARAVDLGRWRENELAQIEGYLEALSEDSSAAYSRPALQAAIGQPILPVELVMTSDSAARVDSVPRRLALPTLDGGPHLSYMLQWFAFATIAVVGGVLLFRRAV